MPSADCQVSYVMAHTSHCHITVETCADLEQQCMCADRERAAGYYSEMPFAAAQVHDLAASRALMTDGPVFSCSI